MEYLDDDNFIFVGSDYRIRIYNKNLKRMKVLRSHCGRISKIFVREDNIISFSDDGNMK